MSCPLAMVYGHPVATQGELKRLLNGRLVMHAGCEEEPDQCLCAVDLDRTAQRHRLRRRQATQQDRTVADIVLEPDPRRAN